jgi:AraC family transcriptional regulator
MNQQLFASQTPLSTMRNGKLVAPQLYLSSAGAGWEGLVAQAYHEPIELDGWIAPATPDISLILFRGGAMQLAQRHANGPWRALDIGQGDLILRAPGRASYEVRWKSHSSTPAQTLHLHLSHQLVARAAEQLAGHDPTRVAPLARVGFRDPVLAQIGLALWRELEQPDPAGKLYAQTAAQMLAVHLLRHYPAGQVVIKEPALIFHQLARARGRIAWLGDRP